MNVTPYKLYQVPNRIENSYWLELSLDTIKKRIGMAPVEQILDACAETIAALQGCYDHGDNFGFDDQANADFYEMTASGVDYAFYPLKDALTPTEYYQLVDRCYEISLELVTHTDVLDWIIQSRLLGLSYNFTTARIMAHLEDKEACSSFR